MIKPLAQEDIKYLHNRAAGTGLKITADTEHDFVERVGIKSDSGIDDVSARDQAFSEILNA